ncbi:SUMF1/EgtB/PvdO family nonheme iron enzyme [Streptomyces tanashiensis]
MVLLPGGTFLTGTDDTEGFPSEGEGPVRSVRLKPFLIDVCAVTTTPSRGSSTTQGTSPRPNASAGPTCSPDSCPRPCAGAPPAPRPPRKHQGPRRIPLCPQRLNTSHPHPPTRRPSCARAVSSACPDPASVPSPPSSPR